MASGALAPMRSLLWLALGVPEFRTAIASASSSEPADETAVCTNPETCGNPLRWRVKSYHEARKSKTYGGGYVNEAIGRSFDGPVEDDDWDALWTTGFEIGELAKRKLTARPGRLVNKCVYFRAAGNKCFFAGHLRRVAAELQQQGVDFQFLRNHVITHQEQFDQWRREAIANPNKTWVVKDCSSGMSKKVDLLNGDALIKRVSKGIPQKWTVAQEYLERPWMGFGGRKFHLRVYVVITHWGPPPRVFLFDDGVVFRSRSKYDHAELDQKRDVFSSLSDKTEAFTHARFWQLFDEAKAAGGEGAPTKGSSEVKADMLQLIRRIFGTALLESFGEDRVKDTQPAEVGFQCFDLFGLDVMFDEDLNPFVLEVNMGPNLNIDDRGEDSTQLLRDVKAPMIEQMVQWMELYVRRARDFAAGASASFEPEAAENATLVGFTRLI